MARKRWRFTPEVQGAGGTGGAAGALYESPSLAHFVRSLVGWTKRLRRPRSQVFSPTAASHPSRSALYRNGD